MRIAFALALAATLAGCADLYAVHGHAIPLNPPATPAYGRPVESVAVLASPPAAAHIDVWLLDMEGQRDTELMPALRQYGAAYGCDAIVVNPPEHAHSRDHLSATCVKYSTDPAPDRARATVGDLPASVSMY